MRAVTLVTGGARSGKSRYAMELALAYRRRVFVATATAFDGEMADRIARHRRERAERFTTVEAPLDLAGALAALPPATDVALVDCLTVWLGNLFERHGAETESFEEVAAFLRAIEAPPCDLVVVTNEVGMGIVPENALARRFRDVAGRLNAEVAARADRVAFMVCGVSMHVKGNRP
jgi:adenosylcobinamide kinase/adenosylcobinamide-phosphate guanylyltransferase